MMNLSRTIARILLAACLSAGLASCQSAQSEPTETTIPPSATSTATATSTLTQTLTSTATLTFTPTLTATSTPTSTLTLTPTETSTPTMTLTSTPAYNLAGYYTIGLCTYRSEYSEPNYLKVCVDHVIINPDLSMKFYINWRTHFPDTCPYRLMNRCVGPKPNLLISHTAIYLTDDLGNRYDYTSFGPPGTPNPPRFNGRDDSITYGFTFPAPKKGATHFTYHQDDGAIPNVVMRNYIG